MEARTIRSDPWPVRHRHAWPTCPRIFLNKHIYILMYIYIIIVHIYIYLYTYVYLGQSRPSARLEYDLLQRLTILNNLQPLFLALRSSSGVACLLPSILYRNPKTSTFGMA